jgi:hypothetical protein
MKTIITILFLASVAANAQVGCGLMPIKPASSCSNLQPVCLCNGVGTCRWQWACQASQATQPSLGGFNTNVAPPAALELRTIPYPDVDPMEQALKYRQAQQNLKIGQQEMQTRALEQQKLQMDLDQRRAINEAQAQQQTTPNPQPISSVPPSERYVRLSETQMQAIVSLLERIAVATETLAKAAKK